MPSLRLPLRMLLLAVAALYALQTTPALAADGTMSAKTYKLYRDYQDALNDPRVKKIRPRHRLRAIARNFGVSVRALKRAIAAGDRYADGLVKREEAAAKAALAKTPIGAAVASVQLVDQDGVVVAYVSWNTKGEKHLAQEASYIAQAVAKAAPITTFVALWSCMGTTKVFTAKIRRSAADFIRPARIEDFAVTRYLKLFDDVHDAFKGSPPTDTKGCGG